MPKNSEIPLFLKDCIKDCRHAGGEGPECNNEKRRFCAKELLGFVPLFIREQKDPNAEFKRHEKILFELKEKSGVSGKDF